MRTVVIVSYIVLPAPLTMLTGRAELLVLMRVNVLNVWPVLPTAPMGSAALHFDLPQVKKNGKTVTVLLHLLSCVVFERSPGKILT